MKILVVEDSMLISRVLDLLLEKQGITVLHTADGSKVLEIVKKDKIDLVTLDLMMPGVSGIDVFTQLKADPETKNTKVLILTAKIDALHWHDELKSCDKFMTKPFDNAELLASVKELLDYPSK